MLVLKTLDSMGPMHGFGIALRIQQISEGLLQLNQDTLYPAVLRKNSMDDIDPSFECSAFAVCTLVFHSSGPRREVASSSTQSSSV